MRWLLVLVLLLSGLTPAWAAPQIVAEGLNLDFGEILQGDQVKHVFRFRNTGDQVLQVDNVRSSCGCTAALLSATRIAPGDIGELRTTFDSTRFKGAIHKTVTMDTNDPQSPQISFAISGDVKAEVLIHPERINWGKVDKDAPLSSVVTLNNLGKTVIKLQAPTVTDPALQGELSDLVLAPGQEIELKITAKFLEHKNRIGGYVLIATDYPKVPQLRVSISARMAK